MQVFSEITDWRRKVRRTCSAAVALCLVSGVLSLGAAPAAFAQTTPRAEPAIAAELARLSRALEAQERRIADQERRLQQQTAEIERQRMIIEQQRADASDLRLVSRDALDDMRATGQYGAASEGLILLGQAATPQAAKATPLPTAPVGEAPKTQEPAPMIAALPEGSGVMTPAGRFVVESAMEYTRSSSNRLVYRGVEIITGIQVGLIEANEVSRDTLSGSVSVRYGLSNRIELEARAPYVYRKDQVTTLAQRDQTISRTSELEGNNLGDIEAAVRYQINAATPGEPVFIAGLRVKSDTGLGPFDIDRDSFGVATDLATGSGFWSVSPSISVLIPSEPIVIFAGLSYGYNIEKDIDKTIGGAVIGNVDPGDTIGANMGFGFALNPRFSYSIGYSHSYIMSTKTEIGTTTQESLDLQIGSVTFGASYRVTPNVSVATSVDVGVTEDAPDVRIAFRVPLAF